MRIVDVQMRTRDLDRSTVFYRDVLELPVDTADGTVRVRVGFSTVTLVEDAGASGANHVAITVPRNRFADAKAWLEARVDLISWEDHASTLQLPEPWNSESAYFLGPDDLLLELIARHALDNAADAEFTSAHLLCVSEVGLTTSDVPAAAEMIASSFGLTDFAGRHPEFTPVGDAEGLLILVSPERPWFPASANLRSSTGSIHVTIADVPPGQVADASGWTVSSAG